MFLPSKKIGENCLFLTFDIHKYVEKKDSGICCVSVCESLIKKLFIELKFSVACELLNGHYIF